MLRAIRDKEPSIDCHQLSYYLSQFQLNQSLLEILIESEDIINISGDSFSEKPNAVVCCSFFVLFFVSFSGRD